MPDSVSITIAGGDTYGPAVTIPIDRDTLTKTGCLQIILDNFFTNSAPTGGFLGGHLQAQWLIDGVVFDTWSSSPTSGPPTLNLKASDISPTAVLTFKIGAFDSTSPPGAETTSDGTFNETGVCVLPKISDDDFPAVDINNLAAIEPASGYSGWDIHLGDNFDTSFIDAAFMSILQASWLFSRVTTSPLVLDINGDGMYTWQQVAIISNVTGITDEAALVASGNLIVS